MPLPLRTPGFWAKPDLHPRRREGTSPDSTGLDRVTVERKALQFPGEEIERKTGIDQGTEGHVAADAAEGLEVSDSGHAVPRIGDAVEVCASTVRGLEAAGHPSGGVPALWSLWNRCSWIHDPAYFPRTGAVGRADLERALPRQP
jgi:hypothetical protein